MSDSSRRRHPLHNYLHQMVFSLDYFSHRDLSDVFFTLPDCEEPPDTNLCCSRIPPDPVDIQGRIFEAVPIIFEVVGEICTEDHRFSARVDCTGDGDPPSHGIGSCWITSRLDAASRIQWVRMQATLEEISRLARRTTDEEMDVSTLYRVDESTGDMNLQVYFESPCQHHPDHVSRLHFLSIGALSLTAFTSQTSVMPFQTVHDVPFHQALRVLFYLHLRVRRDGDRSLHAELALMTVA
ncbi:hypothetical protein PHLCEN_2v13353 [Hermanssonia centrifuga]|uniref:Uncharacterized protein n=1 Tax=Hermanssonia centrifuga TaxID=98765 RepID=A0A2R6NET8_9APHY|nr:hypothetical protein PHLCEN_2v13353 [Hermanssonia centrifuga]